MGTFRRFEDLEVWQKTRELTKRIYAISESGRFGRDFALKDQIRRACISVMSNIAEGFERGGNKEFVQFLSIAKGSIGEAKSQLYVALDQGYLSISDFEQLYDLCTEIGNKIGGLIYYLKNSRMRGIKFK